ncbi:GNAT family N-acetyltransferase [Streptomyces rubiginosohelvolus]
MSSSSSPATDSPAPTDLTTERLILRPWTSLEATAVLEGSRSTHWADDFPAEGDRVIAEFALTAAEVHTVSADVEGANPASVRVLEKAGFQRWAAPESTDHLARFRFTRQDRARR